MATDFNRMPNLIVPGGQKCGTSALARFLSLHPDCAPSDRKEPSFFSRERNLADLAVYRRHFRGGDRTRVLFEASTGYLFETYVPERIRRTLLPVQPDLKCLIVLRRPVDRAISSYLHLKKRFDDLRSILEVFDGLPSEATRLFAAEERRIARALAQGLVDVDRYRDRYDDFLWQFRYVRNSWYTDFVWAFQDAIGSDRVKVIFAEDLGARPHETMSDVFRFLGLSPLDHADFNRRVNPTLLPPGMDIFKRTKLGPFSSLLKRFSNQVLPRIGTTFAASEDRCRALTRLKSALDHVLVKQYPELSALTNRDVSNIWPRFDDVSNISEDKDQFSR